MTNKSQPIALRGSGAEVFDPARAEFRADLVGAGSGPKIAGLGRALLRRSWLLLLTVLVLNGIAYYGIKQITPKYTASADVIVSAREEQVVDLKAVLSGLSGSSDVIESEMHILRSREIARAVVRKLNLDQLAEFNPALRPPGFKSRLAEFASSTFASAKELVAPVLGRAGLSSVLAEEPTPVPAAAAVDETADGTIAPIDPLSTPVDRFLSQLEVASKGRSRVITVSFTSTDSTLAAKVPNVVAEAYIANQLLAKTRATAQATKWLDERVAELREQLLAADDSVEAYRRRAGIQPIKDSTLLNNQISELSQDLMRAREQVAVAQSRVTAMAKINPNAFGLNRDLDAAKTRQASLEASLAQLRQQGDLGSQSEIGLRALQREADAARNLYDKLLARARETSVQSGLQQADASIISRAERPVEPSFPKPAIMQPLFFVASAIIALLMVVWLESLDRGFSSVEQLEAVVGVAAIGAIPLLRWRRGRDKVGTHCLDHPRSPFSDSIRNLHTTLMLSGRGEAAPKTILFTSALPDEGKSSVAIAMARMMASCGKRVLLIDYDMQRSASRRGRAGRMPGLIEVLTGTALLEDTLRRDRLSPAFILPAGGIETTPPDLLGSNAMHRLLGQLSRSFDLILLDGTPVLGGSDTRHLSRLAEATVFVVRWRETRRATTALALRHLVDAGANLAGTLLTMVDPKHYRRNSPVGLYRRQLSLYLNN